MWKRLKDNFETGIEKIKWFSSLFSDRLKIEISIMKLLYQSDEMAKKRDELMRTIGQRIYDLKGYPDRYIMKDRVIMEALSEIEKINNEIDITKKKASDISSIEA